MIIHEVFQKFSLTPSQLYCTVLNGNRHVQIIEDAAP